MSTHGPDNGTGQSLDKGLEDVGRAYKGLQQEQPPELLDQAILNKARRELEARPRWTQFGWLHGLTTAAVFVLAFSLILNQHESVPVEENIELDGSDVMPQVAPATEGVERESAPAERLEYRALQKSATAPAAASLEAGPGGRQEPVGGALQRQVQKSATTPALDFREMEVAAEEVIPLDTVKQEDADFMAISAGAAADAAEPVAAPPEHAAKEEVRDRLASDEAEQRLAEILRLKRAGDPTWEAALEAFVEEYPDYPLPAGLGG
ncbi:MAG: hypothetical protein PVF46_02645 [Lysobacterales bacterium]|jgi:hypothetical protein